MFDKNKNINVGRDINIQSDKKSFENLSDEELNLKKSHAIYILKEETTIKFKRTGFLIVLAFVLFLIIYLGVPYLYSKYGNQENFVFKIFQNEESYKMLSIIASVMTIIYPISDLWKSNDIENKQNEILKAINTNLK
ncbi:MAG: hypothetical protein Q4G27_04785 [Flavobacteriaceae bacterium]|nr:hypothetical protein [Flavobacteriaceae bacterium]